MTFVQDRIVRDQAILSGKPAIRGTRISVELILEVMAAGWTVADILENYPGITHDVGRFRPSWRSELSCFKTSNARLTGMGIFQSSRAIACGVGR